ncbi:hypothetical protein [Saccharothrix xinjiangensis]|uniref:Uncharacterized protein n=1 Tax=Saccharothrix xinjiangensis TaxID=204798 RepID=A0ABV9XWU4_9PSEU
MQPPTRTLDGAQRQAHAMLVACPAAPRGCGQPAGQACVGASGEELTGPGHPHRLAAAYREHPDTVPPSPPEPARATAAPAPVAHLVSVDQLRADLLRHRAPCPRPRWCRASIVRARNERGEWARFDAEPTPPPPAGQPEPPRLHTLTLDPNGVVRAVRLTPGQVAGARAAGTPLHQPHHQTCRRVTRVRDAG